MHHREPMICWQRALERVNVKPKPPTLTDPRQSRTESQAKQTAVRRGRDVFLLFFFISPSEKIRRSLWYSSHVFFRWAQEWSGVCSRALCDCLFCFVWPTIPHGCTWTHTNTYSLALSLSLLLLPIYLSRLIAVIKQRAAARSHTSAVLFSTSLTHAGWNTPSVFFHQQVTGWTRSQIKGKTKRQTRKHQREAGKTLLKQQDVFWERSKGWKKKKKGKLWKWFGCIFCVFKRDKPFPPWARGATS